MHRFEQDGRHCAVTPYNTGMTPQVCKVNAFTRLIHNEAFPGLLLMLAAIVAVILFNSPLAEGFKALLYAKIGIGPLEFPVKQWIKDGLMAIFFLFVSLELKRELVAGVLSNPKHAVLPLTASLGGTIVPAAFYFLFNMSMPDGDLNGWAIPSATDIAFALGVLSLFGNRVPNVLKVFLLAVAIIDDMVAVLIIAFGYSATIAAGYLAGVAAVFAIMMLMSRMNITRLSLYWALGLVLWYMMLHSGVHATLAGVLTAFAIPVAKGKNKDMYLLKAEHALRPWVQFGIMPLYALAFAGFSLSVINLEALMHPLTLGIFFGLFLGKPLGIAFGALVYELLTRSKLHIPWKKLWGVGCLAGIGFTMSLFIGGLAYTDPLLRDYVLMGVYAGSIASAIMGCVMLNWALPKRGHAHAKSPASAFLTGD